MQFAKPVSHKRIVASLKILFFPLLPVPLPLLQSLRHRLPNLLDIHRKPRLEVYRVGHAAIAAIIYKKK
jgi:hypothetical protein